ncbi:uncharacterized protein LOC135475434 isoform X2 [Liolophura sinensis]
MLVATAAQLMLLILTSQIVTSVGQIRSPSCHIPAGKSSLAAVNRDAVRFNFSAIENNVNYFLPNVMVRDHVYAVTDCGLTVYLVSQTIENPSPFLANAGIKGTLFFCSKDTDPLVKSVYGVVLKMIDNPATKPEVIPTFWYNSANIIMQLFFYRGFPAQQSTTYRCKLERNVTVFSSVINVVVTANFSVQKVGCPKTHWGSDCGTYCFSCENGGECDTFKGQCWCLDGFTGTRCETRMTTSTTQPLTTATGTTRSVNMTLKDKTTSGNQQMNFTRDTSTSTQQTTPTTQTPSTQQTISTQQTTSTQPTASANQMTKPTSGHSRMYSAKIVRTLTLFYLSCVVYRFFFA